MSETKISSSEQEQKKQMFEQWKLQAEQGVKILKETYPQANIQTVFEEGKLFPFYYAISFKINKRDVDGTSPMYFITCDTKGSLEVWTEEAAEAGNQPINDFETAKSMLIRSVKKRLVESYGKK